MVQKLTPQQIETYWDDIEEALIKTVPGMEDGNSLNTVLTKLLSEEGYVLAMIKMGKNPQLHAIAIVFPTIDVGTNKRSLLIYCIFGFRATPNKLWLEGVAALERFAKKLGCSSITAYSKVPRILQIAEAAGADIETRYIKWEV